ncbi:hypothetical protein [uncultured Thiodictyon sp.]|jgi:hypothetical protein|uniref:hypothetical protein n=1 Tax=uncultured Thiodictyon sp. TaxID=1846217 RepID=UPI0025E15C02|nr:hypothetical protein [uncultured Thiodictyon sp.]
MNRPVLALALALAAMVGTDAFGGMMTVEPDNFAHGQDISTADPGVTLQLESGRAVYAFDYEDADYASTGTKVFGFDVGFEVEPYWDDLHVFQAVFTELVAFVSIDVVNNDEASSGDSAYMEVFGPGGLLATIDTTEIAFPGFQTLSYSLATRGISSIRVSSVDTGDYSLDRLQYEVPLPTTLTLLVPGLVGLGMRGRRAARGRTAPG